MNDIEARIIKDRLESILRSLRYQNSSADIHTLGNIKNTAQMLLQELEEDASKVEWKMASEMTKRVERDTADFFKKKFSYLWLNI